MKPEEEWPNFEIFETAQSNDEKKTAECDNGEYDKANTCHTSVTRKQI